MSLKVFIKCEQNIYSLFTGNAYPSKPKIDGVGSAKYYEKKIYIYIYIKYKSSLQNCD